MLTLRLYIDESWPDRQRACDWALVEAGRIVGRGRTAPEHWPLTNDSGDAVTRLELVLDPAQYSLHDIGLPPRARQAQSQLIGYALEDRLLETPERYHFVVTRGAENAATTRVVAILSARLAHILASLEKIAGLPAPTLAVPMHELLPPAGDAWLLWQTPDARLLVHGLGIGSMHIASASDIAPLLTTAGTRAPSSIRLIGKARDSVPASVPIVTEPHLDWASGDWNSATNLLAAAFRPASTGTWKIWRGMAVAAGLLLAVHGVLVVGEWIWLANRAAALKKEIALMAGKALGDEPLVAPLAQLVAASDRLRHRRGEVGQGDYLALVRHVAEELGTARIEEMQYGPGRIELRFPELAADKEMAAREAFARAGLDVRVTRATGGVRMLAAWMLPGAEK